MAQLLIVLLVPPAVGLVTYFIVRFSWKRDVFVVAGGPPRRRNAPRPSIFAKTGQRLQNLRPEPSSQGRAVILLALGIAGGFIFGWYLL